MNKWNRVNYLPGTPLGKDGRRVTASVEHIELSKEAAKEGMVLLKNDSNVLPLKKGTKIAVFGKGCIDYVKGGGGSGDVTIAYQRNLIEGLKLKGDAVQVFEPLVSFYKENVEAQYKEGKVPGMTKEPVVPEKLLKEAMAYTDTAIISICRFSGEGWDRKSVVEVNNTSLWNDEMSLAEDSASLFEKGDFYLTAAEEQMVEAVKNNFAKVIVVMNVGGMVDTGWFVSDERIQSVLMAWQSGIEGGLATAELLVGEANPCGKLVDTFANDLNDYPSTANFHESEDFVEYTDDIYVGYRYFETVPGAYDKVNYCFGYGLSYTDFDIVPLKTLLEGNEIKVTVQVTNTGAYEGKEVVQLYYSAPCGKLGKPSRVLGAFVKTRSLKVGESQILLVSMPIENMASYDDLGKVKESAYILEAGTYSFYVGNSVRNVNKLEYEYVVSENVICCQLSRKVAPVNLSKRMLADGSYESLPIKEAIDTDANVLNHMKDTEMEAIVPLVRQVEQYSILDSIKPENKVITLLDVCEGKAELDDFVKQLNDMELADLLGGQPNTGLANTWGFGNLSKYGVPNIMTADGPAGLRIRPECGVCTTAFPCSTQLACTWNEELVERVGMAGGAEVKENNIALWLTPAVNIHRSPLCGRNFEYYSEDPLVAGKLAAAMVRGIQSNHVGATVKHFALNNKETNRKNSDSRCSERAVREIYLKAFEIIVKEANPWAIMSSYNIINGYRASENKELLEDILRGEWGFEGMVTTDWWTCGEHYKETCAGNDLKMATGFTDRLLKAKELGAISRDDMEKSAKRILRTIMKVD